MCSLSPRAETGANDSHSTVRLGETRLNAPGPSPHTRTCSAATSRVGRPPSTAGQSQASNDAKPRGAPSPSTQSLTESSLHIPEAPSTPVSRDLPVSQHTVIMGMPPVPFSFPNTLRKTMGKTNKRNHLQTGKESRGGPLGSAWVQGQDLQTVLWGRAEASCLWGP